MRPLRALILSWKNPSLHNETAMRQRKIVTGLFVCAACGFLLFALIPWTKILEGRVISMLQSKGLQNIALRLDHVGLHQAVLKDVVIGTDDPLLLKSLTLDYSAKELLTGTLQTLKLSGLDLALVQTETGWRLSGIEGLKSNPDSGPVDPAALLQNLPFSLITIEDSRLTISGTTLQATIPFSLTLQKNPTPFLTFSTQSTDIDAGANDILLGPLHITATAQKDAPDLWDGTWNLSSLTFSEAIPALQGTGTLSLNKTVAQMEGSLESSDQQYKAVFETGYDLANPDAATATLHSATLPFKEGRISTQNITIPLTGTKPIALTLTAQKISTDALLQSLTGKRVSATGTVSGTLPLIIDRGGGFTLGKGKLQADGAGLIQMPGDALPGDNEQIELVRDVLENLHYSLLSATVDSAGNDKITVKLSLEGSNPGVYDGRTIKLNVNLTGDVLDFIRQNVMLFNNPEKLLKQGTHD